MNAIVFFATQNGATSETFDAVRCRHSVTNPILRALAEKEAASGRNLVDKVIIGVVCREDPSTDAETSQEEDYPGEGLPRHVSTPTSRALLGIDGVLRQVHEIGRVECLDIPAWRAWADLTGYAVTFAQNQGARKVIVVERGMDFPDPEKIHTLLSELKDGEVKELSLANLVQ